MIARVKGERNKKRIFMRRFYLRKNDESRVPFVIPIIQRILFSTYNQKNIGNYWNTLQKKGGPQKLLNHLHPKEQPLHSPLPPFKSFYSSFILFFPSFLLKVIFTVWSMLESPQQSVLDKVGTSLRHEPTRLHILNKCTCARICTQKQKRREKGTHKEECIIKP